MSDCIVIAHNIRSLHNVGSLFRTAEGAGVAKIYLTGYTGHPPRKEISKVALGSEMIMPWEYRKQIAPLMRKLKKIGYEVVAAEQSEEAIPHFSYKPSKKVAVIFGNEVRGLSKRVLKLSDKIIEIPMFGSRKSLNVSVAAGIVLFEITTTQRNTQVF